MYPSQQSAHINGPVDSVSHPRTMALQSSSLDRRSRADVDSWVEVSSQPSSSSLSSVADEIVTTGLRVRGDARARRRRNELRGPPSHLSLASRERSLGENSSQEEYEESESESDRIMTSSGEGAAMHVTRDIKPALQTATLESNAAQNSDNDDEDKTAINYPINTGAHFTPRPNAFSHPPNSRLRRASQPVPGSYFPASRPPVRPTTRASFPAQAGPGRPSHAPQNIMAPSYNAAAQYDEALRASLSGLLSVAAAARGLQKGEPKRPAQFSPPRSSRVDPMTLRLVPESALQASSPPQLHEPTFAPTIRRTSTGSVSTESEQQKEIKRKALIGRSSSRERRASKKVRRSALGEELLVTPTLLTWVVSAGVVVFISALSFSAGYSIGKEAGRLEVGGLTTDEHLRSCAREAGRSSLGLKRSLARSAIQA